MRRKAPARWRGLAGGGPGATSVDQRGPEGGGLPMLMKGGAGGSPSVSSLLNLSCPRFHVSEPEERRGWKPVSLTLAQIQAHSPG